MENTEYTCPQCGEHDGIDVAIQTWARLTFHETDGEWNGTDTDEADSSDHEWDSESKARCAHCLYSGRAGEFENDEWNAEQEQDEQEQDEPDEDSLVTTNGTDFYQYRKKVLTIDREATSAERNAAIKAYLDREQFWPNVFEMSDHGNSLLIEYWKTTEQPAGLPV